LVSSGKREVALEHVVRAVDLVLRDPVVADAGEAPLAIGVAQFGDEGVAVFRAGGMRETRDVERGNTGL
jgi:hypothetical protein